ncbi:MAG: Flp pilus assembly complex ATPase component TadA [Eubacterium sp.]|nr:Flp pilus assembly complex ATPase component TadA [Eubacterium sp.]
MDAVASEISLVGNVFRIALRDDPDVILIGEMRDYETISLAMMAAETGHLVFGTLHTSSAVQTIDRIIDVCPIHAQVRCATSFQICFRALSRRASFRALTGRGASLRLRSRSARTR